MALYSLLMYFLSILLSANFLTSNAQSENTAQPEVTISQGSLMGTTLMTHHNRNISAFLGIPYGQPPIGNLRFANPVAADGWNGTLDATVDPNMCPQASTGVSNGEEDCLYLNVYTPQITSSPLLPVMVYIHGGAFKYGSQTSTTVGPGYLLDEDVVFVAMNYRLGPLGFLSTGDEVASGNWGLKDQVLALHWVQENIQQFGGDPDQVTLFGESAGAASVHLLTLSDATIGLFHRYITQSGSALATWAYRPKAAYASRAFELGEFVGCSNDTSDSLISCLRSVDAATIINTESQFLVWQTFPDVVWGPTDEPDMDGSILTDSPTNLFAAGKIRDLPSISGVVRDEALVLTGALNRDEELLYNFLENVDTLLPMMCFWIYQWDSGAAWVNATKTYYFNYDFTSNTSVLLSNLNTLVSDAHFYYPARNALEKQHTLTTSPQYFYTFNYRGTFSQTDLFSDSMENYGVSHADDLLYLFPSESLFLHLNETMSETDYEMVDSMVQLWTSFAINGTPTASALNGTRWEPYSTDDYYIRIGNESNPAIELQNSFFAERMAFWTALDASTEVTDASSEDSGTAISTPSLLTVIFLTWLKLFLNLWQG